MKITLLFALAFLVHCSLCAQQWVDTTYYPSGEIHRLYFQRMVGNGDSIPTSALFVRGLKEGDKVEPFPLTDSIHSFALDGQRINTGTFIQPMGGRRAIIEGESGKFTLTTRRLDAAEAIPVNQFYARIGDTVRSNVVLSIPTEDKGKPAPKRIDRQRKLDITDQQTVDEGRALSINFQAEVGPGDQLQNLRWQFPSGQERSFNFTTRGYHLQQADFQPVDQLSDEHTIQLSGEPTLYLYLDSAEKLLTIYQEGKALHKIPVGRQLDEIDISHLAKGNYLLDIVDLGTGEHRYHALQR